VCQNCCKRTILVQVIIEDEVTCFFGTRCLQISNKPSRWCTFPCTQRTIPERKGTACPNLEWRFPTLDATRLADQFQGQTVEGQGWRRAGPGHTVSPNPAATLPVLASLGCSREAKIAWRTRAVSVCVCVCHVITWRHRYPRPNMYSVYRSLAVPRDTRNLSSSSDRVASPRPDNRFIRDGRHQVPPRHTRSPAGLWLAAQHQQPSGEAAGPRVVVVYVGVK